MIEVWHCGTDGEVGGGFTEPVAELMALTRAALNETLSIFTVDPGDYMDLTPEGDPSPQSLVVDGNGCGRLIEARRVEGQAGRAVGTATSLLIGPGGLSRRSIKLPEEPSATGTLRIRVFWLVCHKESTPELDGLRAEYRRQ